jgi:hypothetical protein
LTFSLLLERVLYLPPDVLVVDIYIYGIPEELRISGAPRAGGAVCF